MPREIIVRQGKVEANADRVSLVARDRIADAYFGRFGGEAFAEKTRNRLYWIARNVVGARVLDVGTSEGILPILLAREGFEVVGLDINSEALDYANELLSKESDAVQRRVEFICSGFHEYPSEKKFDTIIAGELIEHLNLPGRFFSWVSSMLEPGGRFIVTCPLGLHPDPDHKQSLFPSDLMASASGLFSVDALEVADGYLRCVFALDEKSSKESVGANEALGLVEDVLFQLQVKHFRFVEEQHDRISRIETELSEAQSLAKGYNDEIEEKGEAFSTLQREFFGLRNEFHRLTDEKERLEKEFGEVREAIPSQEEKVADLQNALAAATDRNEALSAEKDRLSHLLNRHDELKEEHEALRKELANKTEEVETLRDEQSLASDAMDAAQEQLNDRQAKIRTLTGRVGSMTRQLRLKEAQSEELAEALSKADALKKEQEGILGATESALLSILAKSNNLAASSLVSANLDRFFSSAIATFAGCFGESEPTRGNADARRIATQMTEEAKALGREGGTLRALLALAAALADPADFRIKWLMLRLVETGYGALANQLNALIPEVSFSSSELKLLNSGLGNTNGDEVGGALPMQAAVGLLKTKDGYSLPEFPHVLTRNESLVSPVAVDGAGKVQVCCALQEEISSRAALVSVRFYDETGQERNFKCPTLGQSTKYGNYRYIGVPETFDILIPEWCQRIELEVFKFSGSENVVLSEFPKILLVGVEECPRLPEWHLQGFDIPEPTTSEDAPNILGITDEFTEWAMSYEVNYTAATPENWRDLLDDRNWDYVFIESSWAGSSGKWRYAMSKSGSEPNRQLCDFLAEARKKGIKTVFWNKEDPPNFDVFSHLAHHFDLVLTTDRDCEERYRAIVPETVHVDTLMFSAQPKIHNPIGKIESAFDVAFAGSWYAKKHEERLEGAPLLFDAASEHKFLIFDRMSDWNTDDSYAYPEKYRTHVLPKVSYRDLLSIHKSGKCMINVNSVADSPTMFARRVFELLASSTPVVSTPSTGVEEHFGSLVKIPKDEAEARDVFSSIVNDQIYRLRLGHEGHREVFENHLLEHRLEKIGRLLGLERVGEKRDGPLVTWAVPTNRPEHLKFIIENFERQANRDDIELVVALNSDRFDRREVESSLSRFDNVTVLQLPESASLGEVLNATIENSRGRYWMKIDDDNIYLENFTRDMLLPFKYSSARIVGKGAYFTYLEKTDETVLRFPTQMHKYVDFCSGSAIAVKREVLEKHRFPEQNVGEDTIWMKNIIADGEQIYAADPFNYSVVRRADKSSHTWQAADDEVTRNTVNIGPGKQLAMLRV